MPVSSLLVRVTGEPTAVSARVRDLPDAEVTDVVGNTLVVVTDSPDSRRAEQTYRSLESLPGVLSADLIYLCFEDEGLEV